MTSASPVREPHTQPHVLLGLAMNALSPGRKSDCVQMLSTGSLRMFEKGEMAEREETTSMPHNFVIAIFL
jgi:hypothetical protein